MQGVAAKSASGGYRDAVATGIVGAANLRLAIVSPSTGGSNCCQSATLSWYTASGGLNKEKFRAWGWPSKPEDAPPRISWILIFEKDLPKPYGLTFEVGFHTHIDDLTDLAISRYNHHLNHLGGP